MISRLRGILLEKQAPMLLLDVNNIAYEVQATMNTFYKLPELGQEIILFTHFVVREDSQALYGFLSKEERHLFRALIKVNGIGPKLAITILSGVTPEEFMSCVAANNVNSLTHLPGIGKKTAERILLEMRGSFATTMEISANTSVSDAINALITLGYKPQEAQRAVSMHKNSNLSCEELIRLALKDLAK